MAPYGMAAWPLLAIFLIIGHLVYEIAALRLGGVLVLPLFILYALIDFLILLVFAIASLIAFGFSFLVYDRTMLYGRRLLYATLLIGTLSSVALWFFLDTPLSGLLVALLPGLFAYNLHRELRYARTLALFLITFLVLLLVVLAPLWLTTPIRPDVAASAIGDSIVGTSLGGSTVVASLGVAGAAAAASAADVDL